MNKQLRHMTSFNYKFYRHVKFLRQLTVKFTNILGCNISLYNSKYIPSLPQFFQRAVSPVVRDPSGRSLTHPLRYPLAPRLCLPLPPHCRSHSVSLLPSVFLLFLVGTAVIDRVWLSPRGPLLSLRNHPPYPLSGQQRAGPVYSGVEQSCAGSK